MPSGPTEPREVVAGDRITAEAWNAIVRRVRGLGRIVGGRGITVRQTGGATVIESNAPPREPEFVAKITGATLITANRWLYDFVQVLPWDVSGAPGFVEVPFPSNLIRTGEARNLTEYDATASQAGGVDLTGSDIAATNIVPVRAPDGAHVRIWEEAYFDNAAGTVKVGFWFERAVAFDGGCA